MKLHSSRGMKMAKGSAGANATAVIFSSDKANALGGLSREQKDYLQQRIKDGAQSVSIEEWGKLTIYLPVSADGDPHETHEQLRTRGSEVQAAVNRLGHDALLIINETKQGDHSFAVAEGAALSNYQFLKYLRNKKQAKNKLEKIFIQDPALTESRMIELMHLVRATTLARDLVNEPVSYLDAVRFSKEMEKAGKEAGFKVKVLHKKEITDLGMGGLLAVNQGSIDPPTFTVMEYKPVRAKNKKPIVLVGKGVVFDTGGLSLKPTPGSMDEMKCDMAGAAAVVGALYAIAANKLPVHVVGLVPATDNRPGMKAVAPQDVITISDGTTVEVLNTDAEGRLILADALVYAKKYSPELVVDLATLTGAAVRAVGSYASAVMGTAPRKTLDQLAASGFRTWERTVEFPLWKDYGEEMKSTVADLKNLGSGNAGQITAGKFLQHFTDYPWIHIDIAGPAYQNSASAYRTRGGTGVGVRLLYDFIASQHA